MIELNSYKKKKMQTKVGVQAVQEAQKLREKYGIERGYSPEIIDFYDAIETSDDMTSRSSVELIEDGTFDEFYEVVNKLTTHIDDDLEGEVSILKSLADVLEGLKSSGIIDELEEDGFISEDEGKDLKTATRFLDDSVMDIISLFQMLTLMKRFSSDLTSNFLKIKDALSEYSFDNGELVDELVHLGLMDDVEERKILNDGYHPDDDYQLSTSTSTRRRGRRRDKRVNVNSRGSKEPRQYTHIIGDSPRRSVRRRERSGRRAEPRDGYVPDNIQYEDDLRNDYYDDDYYYEDDRSSRRNRDVHEGSRRGSRRRRSGRSRRNRRRDERSRRDRRNSRNESFSSNVIRYYSYDDEQEPMSHQPRVRLKDNLDNLNYEN